MKSIRKHMKGYGLPMLGAMLSVMIATALVQLVPIVIRYTVDTLIGGKTAGEVGVGAGLLRSLLPTIGMAGLTILLLGVLRGVFFFLRSILIGVAAEGIAERLRNQMYAHIQGLSFATHGANPTGDLIQRCTSDLDTLTNFVRNQISELGRLIITVVLSIVIMLAMNLQLTLIPLAAAPILFVTSFYYQRYNKKRFLLADEKEGEMTNIVQESLSGVRVIRAFGREKYEIDRFDEKNSDLRTYWVRVLNIMAMYFGSTDFLSFALQGAVLFTGAWMAIRGEITLGTLVAFFTYVNNLAWPIKQLGRMLSDLGKATVAAKRIDEILELPLDEEDGACLTPEIRGSIVFDHVSFGYAGGEDVLRDVSFEIGAGESLGIVGPTGSGKSTLVQLLQRLYEYRGSIRIDGVELRDIQKRWIRSQVGLVLQEPYLYAKTIRENIGIVSKGFTDEQIMRAARTCAIDTDIDGFKDGYDTLVGEKGVSLSGGQKQRVAISRTIIDASKRILIFDDSLSAVDAHTDAAIRRELAAHGDGITTLIISHRLDTIRTATKILVLTGGEVAECGTHDELAVAGGLYQRLWELQTKSVDDAADADDAVDADDAAAAGVAHAAAQ